MLNVATLVASCLCYDVQFAGVEDPMLVQSMRDASQLVSLQDRPPASINGLRYRAAEDVPKLLQVLRAYSYYDAEVSYEIAPEEGGYLVSFSIDPGRPYPLESYRIFHQNRCVEPFQVASPCELGLTLGKPPVSTELVNAELSLLTELANNGYPLAEIDRRKIEVDLMNKTVQASICVEEGPFSHFGPTTLFGLSSVEPRYILRKIAWKEGEIYDATQLEETQRRLLRSNLFSSVLISHGEQLDDQGELPIKMRLTEAKHKTVNVGVFYATVNGPGVSAGWSDRNLRGMGEILTVDGEIATYAADISTVYTKPDFLGYDQAYKAVAAFSWENIDPYTALSYRVANYIEKTIHDNQIISAGIKLEQVHISHSAEDGSFFLIGLPIFGKISTADTLLNPTRGYSLVYQGTPYQSFEESHARFVKQRLTYCFYFPVWKPDYLILALRTQFGSIAGAKRKDIPLTKLFLGGSEDDLRGYRYQTVSPLGEHHKPLGGRSAIFTTAELRWRMTRTIGIVPFADFGTVTNSEIPQFNAKWYKSLGIGLRYFAFFGPLRFDIGFPLDRRKGIDPRFRIYASVGQTF